MRVATGGGRANPERLTRQQAFYTDLNYTPDGTRIVGYRAARMGRIQEQPAVGRELVWMPATGGAINVVTMVGNTGYPHFTRNDNARIWVTDGQQGLVSMRFDGTDRKQHLKVTGNTDYRLPTPQPQNADEILVSPDGDRALAQVDNNIFVVDLPMIGAQAPTDW